MAVVCTVQSSAWPWTPELLGHLLLLLLLTLPQSWESVAWVSRLAQDPFMARAECRVAEAA